MRKTVGLLLTTLLLSFTAVAQEHEQDRLKNAGEVLTEILGMPDAIPKYWLDRAECVLVFPSVKKFAIGVGGNYGRGAMVCRTGVAFAGSWGAPAMYALDGGSVGLQLGAQATDLVLLGGLADAKTERARSTPARPWPAWDVVRFARATSHGLRVSRRGRARKREPATRPRGPPRPLT